MSSRVAAVGTRASQKTIGLGRLGIQNTRKTSCVRQEPPESGFPKLIACNSSEQKMSSPVNANKHVAKCTKQCWLTCPLSTLRYSVKKLTRMLQTFFNIRITMINYDFHPGRFTFLKGCSVLVCSCRVCISSIKMCRSTN